MKSNIVLAASDNATVWIFLHLSKTGGTTVNGHFRRHMSWDDSFVHFGGWGNRYRKNVARSAIEERSEKVRSRIKVISGHRSYYGIHHLVPNKTPKYFTIIRDPAQRCASRYNFNRSRGKISASFEDWYANVCVSQHRNAICQFLAERVMNRRLSSNHKQNFRLARQLLDLCWHVCLTENLSNDLRYVFSEMGLPTDFVSHRVAGKAGNALAGLDHPQKGEVIQSHYVLSDEMRSRIQKDNLWDVRLYEYARQLNEKQWSIIRSL